MNKLTRTTCPMIYISREGIELHRPCRGLCNDVSIVTSAKAATAIAVWIRANLDRMPTGTTVLVATSNENFAS